MKRHDVSPEAIKLRQDALSHEHLLCQLSYDPTTGHFAWISPSMGRRKNSVYAGGLEKCGYRRIRVGKYRYLAHRLAWFYVHGYWPPNEVDHRNNCRDDNRIENLRLADDRQNRANMGPRKSASGLKGAHWNASRGYWQSYIKRDGRSKFLGRFDDPETAHEAYVAAAKNAHGEFGRAS